MGDERMREEQVVHKPCDWLLLLCVYTYEHICMYIIPLFASDVLQFCCYCNTQLLR